MYIYDHDALLFLCASPSVCTFLMLALFLYFSFFSVSSCFSLFSPSSPCLACALSLRLANALSLCLACARAFSLLPLSFYFFLPRSLSVPPVTTRAFPVVLRGVWNKFCVRPFYERGVGAFCGVRSALTESHCNTMQHVTTRCNTLQHAATRYDTLHYA